MNTLHSVINFLLLLHATFGHLNQQQSQEETLPEVGWSEMHSTLVTQQHQAQQFAQSTALLKELVSTLEEMLKSDDFEARVFIDIRNLISRLGSEKNETEQFLKKVDNQRLTILNKKEEQMREKKRLEDDVPKIRNPRNIQRDYENEEDLYDHFCIEQRELLDADEFSREFEDKR
ncbi:unnamed protein product, partial [Mesorhabditis belari]|uniref:Uncharacterized protein n=1 Tax=Mesorhabditis belari TaxID=2138241 RepID=A0AAF3J6A1_9BILA